MKINSNNPLLILTDKIILALTFLFLLFSHHFLNAQCQIANAGPSRTLCVGSIPVMAANTATGGGIGTWIKISGPGVITNSNSPTTTITGLTAGISTFMWTITNGTCVSSSNMSFTVGPSTAVAGPNQTICVSAGTATLAGNTPVVGTGRWIKVSGPGTITNSLSPSSTVTGLTVGTTVLTWSVSYSSCASSTSNMTITIRNVPTVANAGASQTICATTGSTTLNGNIPVSGTGTWVKVSGPGTITSPLLNNTTITALTPGLTVLTWSISNPPCASSVSNMTITTNAVPSIAAAGPDQTVCVTSTATMAANTPTAGTGAWTLFSGTGTITSPNNPTTTITGLGLGANTFRWTISNNPCLATFDDIIIVGRAAPTIANAGANQTLCATTGTATATMNGNIPTAGTGIWVKVSGSGTITNPLLQNTTVTNISPGVTVLTWSISNLPCTSSTSNVTITVNAPPSVAAAGPDQTVCVSSSATMAANTSTAGNGIWTLVGGLGTITTPTNPSSTITGLGVGNNTFQWTTSNAPCASSSDNIIIVGSAVPSIATAGPNQTICASTGSVTLAGNTPTAGTGTWIKVSGPGIITNSLLPNSTLTGLTAGITVLTWSISNPPCTSSTSNVTITTNGLPTTSNAGPNQTVCATSTATMNGNTPVTGTGIWTLISGSGTISNPNSPNSTITGLGVGPNVFAWTISNPPCVSSISNVTLTGTAPPNIATAGSNQTLCISSPNTIMSANSATAGSGAWTLVSGSGTISNSLSPTTSITGLGLGNNIFAWAISNSPCTTSTSTVSVLVNNIPTIANAGSNQTLCISSNSTTLTGNTAIIGVGTWSLISGSGAITNSLAPNTTVTGLGLGTTIFAWTITNAPCVSSTSTVAIIVNNIPSVANAGSTQTLCSSNPNTIMTANTATVGNGTWSLISGFGTITNSLSPISSITSLGSGTNIFAWTISNAPCTASSSTVAIIVNNIPTIANAGSNQTLCISSPTTTMNGNTPLVGTGTWSLISGSGTITNSLSPTTSVTGLGLGTNIFAWTISNAPCTSSSATVSITVNNVPSSAIAGSNQTLCASSPNALMAANTATIGTGVWTLISGTGSITNSLSPTTFITGLGSGTNIFAWTISNSPCAPSVSNVSLTVNQIPSISNAGSNQVLCASTPSTTMNGNLPVVGNGAWTLISGSGIITNSLSPNTTVTGLGPGNNVFAWTISNSPCVASVSNVTLTVNPAPTIANAGSNQTLCISSPSTTMNGNIPGVGTGVWTLVSGTGIITNSLSPNTTVTGLGLGNNIFAWTISNSPCAPSISNVTITVNQIPSISVAGLNQTLCISSPSTSMNGNFPVVGNGVWTLISGSGVITNSLLPNTTVTSLGLGNNVFAWTISNSPCVASVSNVTLTVNPAPTIANAGVNQTLCISSPSTTMNGNTPVTGIGAWTLISGSGIITNSLLPNTTVTGLGLGNNVFAWTISNSPCASSISNVTITVNQIPSISVAGSNQTLCISSPSTTLNGNFPAVGSGAWTLVSGTGGITNSLLPNTTLTGLGLGNNVFAWTIANAPCSSSSSNVTITVNQAPTIANAGSNQTLCISNPNTVMSANTATSGTGVWTLVSGIGTITNPLSPTSSITGLGLGTNVFAWTISNSPCTPSTSNVTITVNQIPTIANAGSNQTLCISSPSTTMNGNFPTVGNGVWTLVSGSGIITNSLLPTTTITGLGLGTNIFAWTVSNAPCAASASTMAITVMDVPTISNAGTNQTICISSPNTIMAANTAIVGTGIWTLLSGAGTITNSLSPTTSITGLGLGTNIFAWTISNAPCAASTSTMTIVVQDIPTVANAGSNQTLCISSPSTIMNANSPLVGIGNWSLISGTGIITNSLSATTAITGLGLGNNVFAWTISNAPCAPSVSTVTLTVNQVPTLANAGTTQTLCISNPNTSMSANTPTVGSGFWTIISGSGIITNPNIPNTIITGLGLGTNIFAWTISNAPCAPSVSTVALVVNDLPSASNAGISQTLCISTPTTVMTANTPTVGIGTWSLISGSGTITNSLSPTTSITGLGLGTNIFAWTISNPPCAASSTTVVLTVNDVPTIANAGPNQTLCITNPNTVMTANTPTVGTGVWSLISGSGTITNSLSPTTSITGLGLGTNVFAWTISNSPCGPSISTVSVTVNGIPTVANAGTTTQTLCISSPSTTMVANAPTVGTGLWTLVSGSGSITNPNSPNSTITGLGLGTNIFAWTISNAPCLASSSTLALIVNDVPTVANAGPTQTICISYPAAVMAANTPTVGTGVWTLVSGSGTITNPNSPNTTISSLGLGINVFEWTISNPPCSISSSTMAIIVDDVPTIANAGTSQNMCTSNFTLNANNPIVGTGIWTVIAGTGIVTTPTLNTSQVTTLLTGTNTLVWTISNGVCPSSSSTVNLYVNPFPTPANAGPNQTICTSTAVLAGNSPAIGFGVWTVISGGATVLTNTLSNSAVTGLTNGINTFVWNIAFGTCPNSPDTVVIMVDSLPTTALAGSNQIICSSTATMNANIPLAGIGTWSVISGGSTVSTPTLNSSWVIGLATGNNVFEWSIVNGVCPASTSTMSIFVDSYPTPANAGTDFTICASTATLNSNIPTIGTGVWSVIAGGSSVITNTLNTSLVTGLITGTNSLVWTTSNGVCPSSRDTMHILVDGFPSTVNAGPDQAFCLTTTSANLNGSTPFIGTPSWSVISGGGTLANPNSNTSSISGLTSGTNTIVWTNTNGVCPATSDTVNIILLQFPTPANAGLDQVLCPNTTTLAANLPAIGYGNWTIIGGSGAVTNSTVNSSVVTGLSTGTNSLVWTTSNGNCPTSSDTVLLIVLPPIQQANAGNDTTIYVTSTTISGNSPLIGTGNWSFVGGSFNIVNSGSTLTQLTNLVPGLNTVRWTITEGCGSTYDDKNITVIVLEIPNAFSPNSDGINDYFEIPIVDYYKQVELKIVNRWGNVEFEDHDYKNTWNGVSQSGKPLTEDTYFYIVKLDDQVKTGYVLLKR